MYAQHYKLFLSTDRRLRHNISGIISSLTTNLSKIAPSLTRARLHRQLNKCIHLSWHRQALGESFFYSLESRLQAALGFPSMLFPNRLKAGLQRGIPHPQPHTSTTATANVQTINSEIVSRFSGPTIEAACGC